MAVYIAYPELTCIACDAAFRPPTGTRQKDFPVVIGQESANCKRVQELTAQQYEVVAQMRAGVAGIPGGGSMDTAGVFAHRVNLARLESVIAEEKQALLAEMRHAPPGAR